jgi:hypothetical protein
MKSVYFYLFIISILYLNFQSKAEQPPINSGDKKNLQLFTYNVCEYYGQLIIDNGDITTGVHPSFGYNNCNFDHTYQHYDSILSLDKVEYFELDFEGHQPWAPILFCIADSNQILSYRITYPYGPCDTPLITPLSNIILDSIAGIVVCYDKIAVIRNSNTTDNFIVFDSSFTVIHSALITTIPILIERSYDAIGIIGLDSNNISFNVIDIHTLTNTVDTAFISLYSNPKSFKLDYNSMTIAYEPGDSLINLMTYFYSNDTIITNTIYSGSGSRVSDFGNGYFYFQPSIDNSGNGYEHQLGVANLYTLQLDSFYNVNSRMNSLWYAPVNYGFTILNYIDTINNNRIYQLSDYNYVLQDTLYTANNPVFLLSDKRCPITINEYDDSFLKWITYPNPSNDFVNIAASGLICDKDYTLDIITLQGDLKYTSTIQAKMNIKIPIDNLSPGIYLIRIHSQKGMVVQKFVKT